MKKNQTIDHLPHVTAAEMRQNLAMLISQLKTQPVAMLYHGQKVGVMLSVEDYQRLIEHQRASIHPYHEPLTPNNESY